MKELFEVRITRDSSGRIVQVWTGWGVVLIFVALVAWAILGCTPHVAPIDIRTERVEQRIEDLQHECERCGEPATENVSEVADEFSWRCDKCVPREPQHRARIRKARRKIHQPKLERNWV